MGVLARLGNGTQLTARPTDVQNVHVTEMLEETTRIDFDAPTSLVERVDAVADVLDTSRTRILIDALRDELEELAQPDEVLRELTAAFYEGDIEFQTVESILGREEALRLKLVRDSIDSDPPEPELRDPPSAAAFYEGSVQGWTPERESDDEESVT